MLGIEAPIVISSTSNLISLMSANELVENKKNVAATKVLVKFNLLTNFVIITLIAFFIC